MNKCTCLLERVNHFIHIYNTVFVIEMVAKMKRSNFFGLDLFSS